LAIRFSPLAQVTQFTVPFGYSGSLEQIVKNEWPNGTVN
jgi:hypothetical protein